MKMDLECSTETSVNFCRATLIYIPEDSNFYIYRCDNHKSKTEVKLPCA
jgi:hypothetical protein